MPTLLPPILAWSLYCFNLSKFKCLYCVLLLISVRVSCWKYLIKPTKLLILPALSKWTTSEDVVCKELSYDLIELFKCSKFFRFEPGLSFIPDSLLLPFNFI